MDVGQLTKLPTLDDDELLGFCRLEAPCLSELLDLQIMMHIAYMMHCINI
jgi:hypothetical protein